MASEFYHGTFPDGFMWSTATASYQIEGAWNKNGKGESIWDVFCHTEGRVYNGDTGDVACDSYHKYEEDAKLAKSLGTSHYRFSLSWPRILPKGTTEVINQDGIDYYNRVIDAYLAQGIQPVITLYHWDLPQALQDQGGWTNPKLSDYFQDYAKICYEKFGDRVKKWITFNETMVFVWLGNGIGEHAPGISDPAVTPFVAGHTIIRAHAKAYRAYDQEFRARQNGQVGITLNMDWSEPKDPSNPEHVACSERMMQFKLGWWACPIYGTGDYPEMFKQHLENVAKQFGMETSPLPKFTVDEIKDNKGTWDFFGLNHYTTRIVSPLTGEPADSTASIMGVLEETDPAWKRAQSKWLYVVPWGLRKLLNWIKKEYNNPPLYITENGFSDKGTLDDQDRIDYYRGYINEVLKAVRLDGCDVKGYTAWSLLDNFEWAMGYSERFGLHHVDFDDKERTRTPKASANFYAGIIRNNGFPHPSKV